MKKKLFSLLALLCLTISGAWAITGSGTSDNPYLIGGLNDWNTFASKIESGETTACAKLTANIEGVSTMAGATNSTAYAGTFDGDGYSITLNINTTQEAAGLFRYAKGATIKNLNLKGTITSTSKYIGSFVGELLSGSAFCFQTICSSVAITSSLSGDLTSGGIVGCNRNSNVTITDCLFTGSITGSNGGNMCGGIVGYGSSSGVIMTRVIQAGTFNITTSDYDGIFIRNKDASFTASDCYFVNGVGGTSTCTKADQITTSQLNSQTYVNLLQTGKSETYWGLKNGVLTWVARTGPEAKFKFDGKTIFALYAPEGGGTVDVPSVSEMESAYYIQNATFTYAGNPFTSSTFFNDNIEVTIGGTLLVGGIEIAASATTLFGGETAKVDVTITPYYADYTLVSSNPNVASVTQDGTVAYVGPGSATITATAVQDPSKTATVDITCSDISTVTIDGDASSSGNTVPYTNFYRHGTSQQIYTPEEVGPAGTLKAIAFNVASASSFATNFVKIYLGHKSGTFSDINDYVPASNLTLVYDGNPTLGLAIGWEKLTFNQNGGEFEYNGTDNLVVVVCKSAASYESSLKYSCNTKPNYTIYRQDDNDTDYADVNNTSKGYRYNDSRPSVKFWVEYPRTKYYIVGNMNEWTINDNYELTLNAGAAPVEEYMITMNLTTTNQFKVKSDGEVWYPDGVNNNYGQNGEITADGNYTIYFRPNGDGGNEWFYNDIFLVRNLTLADNADNSSAISAANGQWSNVTLSGRTLYKDASWNTICLPFAVADFAGTPLEGAIVKELTSASLNGSELTLNFSDALTAIEAGKPYFVQWAAADAVVNPVFSGVTVSSTITDKVCDLGNDQSITFKGVTSPVALTANDLTKLYLGSNNTLYYPGQNMSVNACRAYFELTNIEVETGSSAAPSLRVVLNLDDAANATSILNTTESEKAVKFWQNGQFYILHNGKVYDMVGRIVRK